MALDTAPTQASAGEWLSNRAAGAERGSAVVSICVPFFKFDLVPLVEKLLCLAGGRTEKIELLLLDDASDDERLTRELRQRIDESPVPVRLLTLQQNQGRAKVRNHLAEAAQGGYLLFLDCDMYPDSDEFIVRYLEYAATAEYDVIVGGCSYVRLGSVRASQLLYFYHSNRTQCVSVAARRRSPVRYFFTNNMMIRRSLFARLEFDPGYKGWGYEDTDLAVAAARAGARIAHIENTATHLGLVDDDAVISKYRNSVANFMRLIGKYPQEARSFPVYRAARVVARMPLPFDRLSAGVEILARTRSLPVTFRYVFLQCMKLLMYSAALRQDWQYGAER
ncbi:MAG: glycosyltransferase [Steroidobacteraceae bacterium]